MVRPGDGQRLLRAERSRGPARPLRGAGPKEKEAGRRGSPVHGRGLRPGSRIRHAPGRRAGRGHRPAGHAAHRFSASIREVILFPLLRPESGPGRAGPTPAGLARPPDPHEFRILHRPALHLRAAQTVVHRRDLALRRARGGARRGRAHRGHRGDERVHQGSARQDPGRQRPRHRQRLHRRHPRPQGPGGHLPPGARSQGGDAVRVLRGHAVGPRRGQGSGPARHRPPAPRTRFCP